MTTKERLKSIATIAFPMMISHASETVMLFVDRLMLSRVGKQYLSAAMSGGLSSFVMTSLIGGVVGYVNALVAQYYGANKRDQCSRAVTQALYLAIIAYPLLLALIPVAQLLFKAAGHDPGQIVLESTYLRILLSGSILFLLRNAFGGFFTGIGKTRIVMIANVIAMAINIPANYVLIFGKFGFPEMGIAGAAYGTLLGSFSAAALLAFAYVKETRKSEYYNPRQWRPSGPLFGKLLRFGAPAGIEGFLNVMAFNLFVQFMHSYGPDVAAAVTITFNWDLVAFIPMLGMGIATTALVGQQIGAKKLDEAEAIAILSLKLSYIYSFTMMVLFITAAKPMVMVFSSGFDTADGDVTRLAVTLLRLASLYTVADSTQLVFAGALRGAGDTAWIMRISVILHWVLASVSIVLIRVLVVSPVLVWCFFILMILILGVAMFVRFKSGKWKSITLIE